MAVVEGAGVELSYAETGEGPAAVLVHDLASDGAALRERVGPLPGRVVAFDRRGYGASGAPEPYRGTTVEEQAQDLAALITRLRLAPALVVGDGFGALVALDTLKRHRGLVRAAVLVDPPLLAFVPEATEILSAQRLALEEALRADGPQTAVEGWLAGRATGAALDRARAAHRAFFADFAGMATWPVTRRELRALAAPVIVVTSDTTPAHVVRAAQTVAELIPGARHETDGDVAQAAMVLGA